MATLKEMVVEYDQLRTRRMELEHQAEEIKKGRESELKNLILLEMSSQGLKTANFEGIGRITSRNKSFYEIQDTEKLARALMQSMIDAGRAGRPLSDGLFLQKRISGEVFETLMAEKPEEKMETYGIAQVTRQELSVTKR